MKTLSFDRNIFSIEAVKRATYDLPKECQPQISTTKHAIAIKFIDMNNIYEQELYHKTLDHQLRLDSEEKYKLIRIILVAQAIDPQGDLDTIVDAITTTK